MGVGIMARKPDEAPEKTKMKPEPHVKSPVGASRLEDEEFSEFCEADKLPVEASSEFKEKLRQKLWKLLKDLHGLWVLLLGGLTTYHH